MRKFIIIYFNNIKDNTISFIIYTVLYVIHIQYKFQIQILKIKEVVGIY